MSSKSFRDYNVEADERIREHVAHLVELGWSHCPRCGLEMPPGQPVCGVCLRELARRPLNRVLGKRRKRTTLSGNVQTAG